MHTYKHPMRLSLRSEPNRAEPSQARCSAASLMNGLGLGLKPDSERDEPPGMRAHKDTIA